MANSLWSTKAFAALVATSITILQHPSQLHDIDEQCEPWKRIHKCRCYKPDKPEKWHFKYYASNSTMTGYQYNFYFYEEAGEERDFNSTAPIQPIKCFFVYYVLYHNDGHFLIY